MAGAWFVVDRPPSKLPLPPGVHLILGGSPGGIFNRNYGSRQLIVEQDSLNSGPTPRCEDWNSWRAIRIAYWRSVWPPPLNEWNPDPFSLYGWSERLRDAEFVHVWAGTGQSEQLFVAFAVHVMRHLDIEPSRLRLLQFERMKSSGDLVVSMGFLNEANMAAHPEPKGFSASMIEDYLAAWRALTSSDPGSIEYFSRDRPDASGWLKSAMALLLRQFPFKSHGLPYWDLRLLDKVRERGPRLSRVIEDLMLESLEDGDYLDHHILPHRLRLMARAELPHPLVRLVEIAKDMRQGSVELTSDGDAVLDGEFSNAELNPIDDWAAGVRLSSAEGKLWFNDGGRLVRG